MTPPGETPRSIRCARCRLQNAICRENGLALAPMPGLPGGGLQIAVLASLQSVIRPGTVRTTTDATPGVRNTWAAAHGLFRDSPRTPDRCRLWSIAGGFVTVRGRTGMR